MPYVAKRPAVLMTGMTAFQLSSGALESLKIDTRAARDEAEMSRRAKSGKTAALS